MPIQGCHRITRLIELNKDIYSTSEQIDKAQKDIQLLQILVVEFSRLVFDKLTLDAAYERDFDCDIDLQALRVVIGRIKVAMKYFTPENAPISQLRCASKWKGPKDKNRFEKCYMIYLSRSHAERHLCKLTDKLVELQKRSDGLPSAIRRIEEDNKALRSDITSLGQIVGANDELNFRQNTWARLAGVDLKATCDSRKSMCSQRHSTSLNMRRMASTTTKGINYIAPPHNNYYRPYSSSVLYNHPQCSLSSSSITPFQHYPQPLYTPRSNSMHANIERQISTTSSRRRSGALSDIELSHDDSMASTNTSFSIDFHPKTGIYYSSQLATNETSWNPTHEKLRVFTSSVKSNTS